MRCMSGWLDPSDHVRAYLQLNHRVHRRPVFLPGSPPSHALFAGSLCCQTCLRTSLQSECRRAGRAFLRAVDDLARSRLRARHSLAPCPALWAIRQGCRSAHYSRPSQPQCQPCLPPADRPRLLRYFSIALVSAASVRCRSLLPSFCAVFAVVALVPHSFLFAPILLLHSLHGESCMVALFHVHIRHPNHPFNPPRHPTTCETSEIRLIARRRPTSIVATFAQSWRLQPRRRKVA